MTSTVSPISHGMLKALPLMASPSYPYEMQGSKLEVHNQDRHGAKFIEIEATV